MLVQQTRIFARAKKKLHPKQICELDIAVRRIIGNPQLGKQKKGDLNSIRVYKHKLDSQEYLIAYRHHANVILLLALGSHENFYRDIKRTRKKRLLNHINARRDFESK